MRAFTVPSGGVSGCSQWAHNGSRRTRAQAVDLFNREEAVGANEVGKHATRKVPVESRFLSLQLLLSQIALAIAQPLDRQTFAGIPLRAHPVERQKCHAAPLSPVTNGRRFSPRT